MRLPLFSSMLLAFIAAASLQAQYVNFIAPGTPRTRDGKPNLSAPAPRVNGKPDLSGVWQAEAASVKELTGLMPPGGKIDEDHPFNGLGEDDPNRYFINLLADYPLDKAPLQPAAAAAFMKNLQGGGDLNPAVQCLPSGPPHSDLVPVPYKLVQTPGLIVMLMEGDTSFRQFFLDGRPHPKNQDPSWYGYSVGKWEGDTLVVETVGINARGTLDAMGHIHSDSMRLTERFRRIDYGHMELQITVDDPKTLTKPITIKVNQRLQPESDLIENFCVENEKDAAHMRK